VSTPILQINTDEVREINRLADELLKLGRQTIEKAIRIGELLTQKKAKVAYGDWNLWMEVNLNFSPRTAQRWMRLYQDFDKRKTDTMADLESGFNILSDNDLPVVPDRIDPKTVKKKPRKKRAGSIRIREKCPTCGRVMTKEIIARIKKAKSRFNEN
jgi:hypothetical protein